ncbi:MAG TPA: NB-ARC domain-containing protein, partial [Candidatus Limnocylindrales bacterium]
MPGLIGYGAVTPWPRTTSVDTHSYVGPTETVDRISNLTSGVTTNTDSLVGPGGDRLGVKVGGSVNWFLPDPHGDIAASLNATETGVPNAIRYDAWGETLATGNDGTGTAVGADTWKYQGRLDVSPGALGTPLYEAGARFYAPGIGAFTSLDTVQGSAQDPRTMNAAIGRSPVSSPRMSSSVTSSQTPAWPAAALPVPDSITIGREELVAEVTRTLVEGDPRVVVLSGLGGVGKSRIAIEVSRRVAEAFGGRAAWVNLRNAPRVGGLQSSIATAFDVSVGEPEHFAETVAQSIGRKPALLVLDGAEALLHDLRMVDDLVKEAPALRVLVTSRVAVPARAAHARAAMESITVDVLDVPAETDDAETVAASPAVQLLVARAARAKADVEINDRTAPSIARLVAQLDGLPLAIELAAPLLKVLPPHLLVARIGDQLDPVVATIDWSHEQLSAEDRRLYRRLVVFGIPFRARHVRTFSERAISHGLSPLAPDVSDALERLAGAGLIRARADRPADDPATGPDDPRGLGVREYELPALIREDAKRRLDASGETTAAMWARANDLLALCELSHAELVVRSRRDLLDQLDIVHGDLIAALDRARAAGEGRFLLRMTGALAEYWRSRGRLAEGRIWLDAALRAGPPERTAERARALHGSGMLANWQSDFGRARAVLLEALDIRLELGLKADAAATLNQLGLIGLDTGDLAEAEARCRQGLEIRRELGDEAAIAASLNTLGGV